jgi:phosphoenolpyruvate carboxykinase (GTP)
MRNNPALDPDVEKGEGVPISAIIFGGRRSDTAPLVYQAFDWAHGVYLGATMASETTAAATGAVGKVRRDPMAMLPFCGYNIGDYFQHWLDIGKRLTNPPQIFSVNWFRKGAGGKFLWPGFGENMRVLKWIIDRCEENQKASALESPIGWLPSPHDLELAGLDIDHKSVAELLCIDHEEWQKEIAAHEKFFDSLGGVVPEELQKQREKLAARFKECA